MYYVIHWQKTLIVFIASVIVMNGIFVLFSYEFNPDVFIPFAFVLFLISFAVVQVYERFRAMNYEIESLNEKIGILSQEIHGIYDSSVQNKLNYDRLALDVKILLTGRHYKELMKELYEQQKQKEKEEKRKRIIETLGDRYVDTTAEHVGKTTLLFMNNGTRKEEVSEEDSVGAIVRNLRRRGRG